MTADVAHHLIAVIHRHLKPGHRHRRNKIAVEILLPHLVARFRAFETHRYGHDALPLRIDSHRALRHIACKRDIAGKRSVGIVAHQFSGAILHHIYPSGICVDIEIVRSYGVLTGTVAPGADLPQIFAIEIKLLHDAFAVDDDALAGDPGLTGPDERLVGVFEPDHADVSGQIRQFQRLYLPGFLGMRYYHLSSAGHLHTLGHHRHIAESRYGGYFRCRGSGFVSAGRRRDDEREACASLQYVFVHVAV